MSNMRPVEFGAIIALLSSAIFTAIIIMKKKGLSGNLESGRSWLNKEMVLEEAFGSHMYADMMTLEQVVLWVKQRQNLLENGVKAFTMKVTPETLRKLGVTAKLNGENDRYLVIAIVNDNEKKMKDSVLIKYNQLDEKLEQILEKGDGMLVINR